MSSIEQRVNRGVRWLDEHAEPDWRHGVDPEELCMESAYRCVLGQAFHSEGREHAEQSGDGDDDGYTYGCTLARAALAESATNWHVCDWAREHGFSDTGDPDDWADLGRAWKDRLLRDALPVA